jgi:hypothetical protein
MVVADRTIAQPDRAGATPYRDLGIRPRLARQRSAEMGLALATIEVRWFFQGPLSAAPDVEPWFMTRPGGDAAPAGWEPAPPAWREDRYLPVPDADDIGIKWREGRLEIKGRIADLGPCAFAPDIEGRCERWIKWSSAGEFVSQRFLGLFEGRAAAGIILVEKRRLQWLFKLGEGGETTAVNGSEPRVCGLNLELARIRVGGRGEEHWSLAFEAFPGDTTIDVPFMQAVARLLEGCPALPLSAARSMAYPRRLRQVEGASGVAADRESDARPDASPR